MGRAKPNGHDRGHHPLIAQIQTHERESITQTTGRVEVALLRRCEEEAHSAIEQHFIAVPPLTWQSNVAELDLEPLIVNAVQAHEIETAQQLREAIWSGRLLRIPQMNVKRMQACIAALEAVGRQIQDWVI